jgi:protease-4
MFTDATTLTGSIGIFYPKMDLSGLLEKVGVGVDITGLGANASMRSWFKPYSDHEREAAMRGIQDSYNVFVERVGRSRSMSVEEVDEVARGRVFSGARAIEVGLADEYGGLREAVFRARRMAGMRRGDDLVVDYPPRPTLLQKIKRLFGLKLRLPIGSADGPQAAAMGLVNPILRVLRELPPSLWMSEGPEAMALDIASDTIE